MCCAGVLSRLCHECFCKRTTIDIPKASGRTHTVHAAPTPTQMGAVASISIENRRSMFKLDTNDAWRGEWRHLVQNLVVEVLPRYKYYDVVMSALKKSVQSRYQVRK